jgi:FAD/FMN-containing dehydrogenase
VSSFGARELYMCLCLCLGLGLLYGGGLSWYTNQHGLASDNAVAFDLVLPNGTLVDVTQTSQPDLYFGLRGGLSNFGVVTGVTVKAWPTGGIWVSCFLSLRGDQW